MATYIETLVNPDGDQVMPRTTSKAVIMDDGTTLESAVATMNTNMTEALEALGLPTVTADDDGKILTVKDGKYVLDYPSMTA